MGENTKIEWADFTQNWWLGCTQISPACNFCYAKAWAERFKMPELWQGKLKRTSAANWAKPIKWAREAAKLGVIYRVFSNSLSDFFDNQAPDEWRRDAWHIIATTPHLDWLLLTKRPQNICKMLPIYWPLYNVWLGTTVENRDAKRRIDHLRAVPATVRFLSCEPLLEDLGELDLTGIDLVIVGGESGPNARPMHPDWVRNIRDQCAGAGVSFFFKQWGEFVPCFTDYDDYGRAVCYEDGAASDAFDSGAKHKILSAGGREYWRIGKKAAGRLLDGRTHDEMPVR